MTHTYPWSFARLEAGGESAHSALASRTHGTTAPGERASNVSNARSFGARWTGTPRNSRSAGPTTLTRIATPGSRGGRLSLAARGGRVVRHRTEPEIAEQT